MGQANPAHSAPEKLVIASRESALAMWQAEHIRDRLRALYPATEVSILGMTTQRDQILDVTLSKIGGKGLFVKELETALEDGRADLAVHSLKDVPMQLPAGFVLAAIGEREDPHDAFVSNNFEPLAELPAGSVVGNARRGAQPPAGGLWPGAPGRCCRVPGRQAEHAGLCGDAGRKAHAARRTQRQHGPARGAGRCHRRGTAGAGRGRNSGGTGLRRRASAWQ